MPRLRSCQSSRMDLIFHVDARGLVLSGRLAFFWWKVGGFALSLFSLARFGLNMSHVSGC